MIYIYIYIHCVCVCHSEDVHEGSMIFDLGEVRWKRGYRCIAALFQSLMQRRLLHIAVPGKTNPQWPQNLQPLWMKVDIWGKSSNMHSLIHGVYSNYLVIDLADYIFCSAMIFFVQHFVGDFLELHCCHVAVTLALTCQSDLFPVATWQLIRPRWCCSAERNVVT